MRPQSCISWWQFQGKMNGLRIPEAPCALPALIWERLAEDEAFSEISSTSGHGQAWINPRAYHHYLLQRPFFRSSLRKQIPIFYAWQLVWFAKSPSTAALFLAWTNWWSPLGVLKAHITGKHIRCYSSSRQAWFSSWKSGRISQRDNKIQSPLLALDRGLMPPPV